jgi:hypothetical protein
VSSCTSLDGVCTDTRAPFHVHYFLDSRFATDKCSQISLIPYDTIGRLTVFTLNIFVAGFEVLTALSTKMAVFWIVKPCSMIEINQRFGGPCCLHH